MTSTGARLWRPTCLTSSKRWAAGNLSARTALQTGLISTCQAVLKPACSKPWSNPPMPANRLPTVGGRLDGVCVLDGGVGVIHSAFFQWRSEALRYGARGPQRIHRAAALALDFEVTELSLAELAVAGTAANIVFVHCCKFVSCQENADKLRPLSRVSGPR